MDIKEATTRQLQDELAQRAVDVAAESAKGVAVVMDALDGIGSRDENGDPIAFDEDASGKPLATPVVMQEVKDLGLTIAADDVDQSFVKVTFPLSTATGMEKAFLLALMDDLLHAERHRIDASTIRVATLQLCGGLRKAQGNLTA